MVLPITKPKNHRQNLRLCISSDPFFSQKTTTSSIGGCTFVQISGKIDYPIIYTDPDGRNEELGIFVITAYNIAHETDYPVADMIQPNGLDREYARLFLQDVLMQGTGIDSDGNYITIDWLQGQPTNVNDTYFTYVDGVRGASGRLLEDGVSIAVDPAVIPLGSWVDIEGFGLRRADDTGGAIIGNHIDLFMDVTHEEAMEFGRVERNVTLQTED
jgi:3D (Asp-Asp-Asp) domain-containing protein